MSRLSRAARKSSLQLVRTVMLAAAAALAGCGGSDPAAPTSLTTTTTPPAAPVQLAVFTEPASGFMTSDVRDVQGQIVRFDTANNALLWAADGRSFQGYAVQRPLHWSRRGVPDRFGTKDGDRRA
jgi:hypothetical protein